MLGAIIILLVIGIGFWGYTTFTSNTPEEYVVETPSGSTTVNTATGTSTPGAKTFTKEDIALHKDATSCYSSINGSVYDLTAWVNLHPGGKERIISICGIDGTERFMKKHQGAQKFMDILARFKIGTLS